jgi:spoIIIJ-associated protein
VEEGGVAGGDSDDRGDRKRVRPAVNDPGVVGQVRTFLEGTLGRMGLEVEVSQREDDGDVVLEIHGHDAAVAIGKHGATLDALQLLCNRVARKGSAGDETIGASIVLDAEGYRARREQSLASMARRLGAQAVKEGTVITLDPMPPRDRRVVHMALARFPGVVTRSEGDGLERRLQIIPMPERR